MKLKNFPLHNARPRSPEQTRDYVKALSLKRNAEQISEQFAERNQSKSDLDDSQDGVALSYSQVKTYNLGYSKLTGALSMNGEGTVEHMQVDVVPDRKSNRSLGFSVEGERVRYRRHFEGSKVVEHLVHDTATDTINYFLRTPEGRFVKD